MAEQIVGTEDVLTQEDKALLRAIKNTLYGYEPLRATRPGLDVRVHDGRVELRGLVRTLAMKEIAEYLILRVQGVRAVRNDIVADPEIVLAVAEAMAADNQLADHCIRVDSRGGAVILAGDVPSEAIATRAQEVAAGASNVVSVTSAMRVGVLMMAGNGAAS
jgi:osmotically-inducible protein OsmY